jgi:beta-galactosidase
LQGFGSGNPESGEDYFAPARTTFNGTVLAVIRPSGTAGTIQVRAEAEGCAPKTIAVTVK